MIKLAVNFFGDWAKADRLLYMGGIGRLPALWSERNRVFANLAATNIRQSLEHGDLRPNSAATIFLKESAIPLVESGELKASIGTTKLGHGSFYGGVHLTRVHARSGLTIAEIAVKQNIGYTIPVTDELRTRLRARGLLIRNDTKVLIVPPRPFIDQGIEKTLKTIDRVVEIEYSRDVHRVVS